MGSKGIVCVIGGEWACCCRSGIGDTIRISLTPEPGGDRTLEVKVAQELLQTMGFRTFVPLVAACPGCGRTTSTVFQELAGDIQTWISTSMPEWKTRYPGVEKLNVAVMGCIVNGPGESKHADIGISLPGTGETPAAPVFIDGKKALTLRGGGYCERVQDARRRLHRKALRPGTVNPRPDPETLMAVKRIVANIAADSVGLGFAFYGDALGMNVVMDLGFIVTLAGEDSTAPQISIASEGGSGTPVPDLTIEVDNFDDVDRRLSDRGFTAEYGPVVEPWGVRRFFVRDPYGRLVNILEHS